MVPLPSHTPICSEAMIKSTRQRLAKPSISDIVFRSNHSYTVSAVLVQKALCLIDLRRQVRTSASIGVVQHDERSVLFADDIFGKASFSVVMVSVYWTWLRNVTQCPRSLEPRTWQQDDPGKGITYETSSISAASRLFIDFSNPPL
jgi:hypothetical protein